MARKRKNKNSFNHSSNGKKNKKFGPDIFSFETKKKIIALLLGLLAISIIFSFFEQAGIVGIYLSKIIILAVGKIYFVLPIIFLLGGFFALSIKIGNSFKGIVAGFSLLVLGLSGLLSNLNPETNKEIMLNMGGWVGYFLAAFFSKFFGSLLANLIFIGFVIAGVIILWQFLKDKVEFFEKEDEEEIFEEETPIKELKVEKLLFKEKLPQINLNKKSALTKAKTEEEITPEKDMFQKKLMAQQKEIGFPLPPIDLLEKEKDKPTSGDIAVNSAIIKRTLENFGIPVEMAEVFVGPTVTQYTLKPAEGVRLSKITALSNDLSLSLAAHPIRVEAPIPGKSLVGIEVPNTKRAAVMIRSLIEAPEFQESNSLLKISLGKDVAGDLLFADMEKMPHLLVAGATGSGKTIFLNTLINSLLYKNSPETLRLILIDPKRVEFSFYEGIPHLLTPVIHDASRAINALNWLVKEMEKRFAILSEESARNINGYNAIMIKKKEPLMPFIVLVVDELADLMSTRGRDLEAVIVRLAQMSRAVGIHLVLATQRPSVEVLTGLIKANITSRVAFQVASQVDSRTILDIAGADKLLGRGDMLFISTNFTKPKRIQGALISEKEAKDVIKFIKDEYQKLVDEKGDDLATKNQNFMEKDLEKDLERKKEEGILFDEDDPLFEEAKRIVIESKKASSSLLQRRLRVGYARAARLIDMLEEKGIVGPADGAKPREILIGFDEIGLENEQVQENQENNENENNENNEWKSL
ncbi:MAG: DNA translocase FtsK 4TM domain-containing protein [bacterium]|nr:DNA translocase FtsK 4TM domain-containing protein [bacterium]